LKILKIKNESIKMGFKNYKKINTIFFVSNKKPVSLRHIRNIIPSPARQEDYTQLNTKCPELLILVN
jgi:hypothetical protein